MSTVHHSRNKKPLTSSLLLEGAAFLIALGGPSSITSAQADTKACLIQTIDTSQWSPPSPDPSGITLLPNGHLLISDAEVEELPAPYFAGSNLYEADTLGTLLATASTLDFTTEPTGVGVAINPANGHLFFSDDDKKMIFEVDLGLDGKYGTADDIVTSFSTAELFGINDPEGVAFGQGTLFVADGSTGGTTAVYQIDPGQNGIFGDGDDMVTNFDTVSLGVADPEGVAFNPDTVTLYVVGADNHLIETTTTGTLVQNIDLTALNVCNPADVVRAPGSLNPGVQHLYIADRGVDNDLDPLENDGKVYEIPLAPAECALLGENLLRNPGFELDCNNNTFPDVWTSDSRFTRSNAVVHSGKYAGKHSATDDSSYAISQLFTGLSEGTTYIFSGWVNIPPTLDAFTFTLKVVWRDDSGAIGAPETIKTYTAATLGWDPVVASLVAPATATNARVLMDVMDLNATIYVDDFLFTTPVPGPPTISSFTPSSGPVGTVVTISGSHFTGAMAVAFNGVPASAFTVDSDTQITAAVPSGATAGPISVTTVAGTGVSTGVFIVITPLAPPSITSFDPTSGPVGTVVTITGNNFTGATAVAFNITPATDFTVDSDTQITAVVPDGATTGRISVTRAAGTGVSGGDFTVTVVPPVNLLLNPGFELDANIDTLPDNWTSNSHFTRSADLGFVHGDSFAGKHFSIKSASYVISQTITGLSAGTRYSFSGWVNIPTLLTKDNFMLRLEVRWLDASNHSIATTALKTYRAATSGWDQTVVSLVAPAGTTKAEVRMAVKGLRRTIYVDDFAFITQ